MPSAGNIILLLGGWFVQTGTAAFDTVVMLLALIMSVSLQFFYHLPSKKEEVLCEEKEESTGSKGAERVQLKKIHALHIFFNKRLYSFSTSCKC